MTMNAISVVMSAYNVEKWIATSIESILKQTFPDFELIIIDDGSTDNTRSIIQSYTDERIKLITNSHDFISSLNKGLDAASGEFIARMDADDIMHIDRLAIEYAMMKETPQLTACSSWMYTFGKGIANGNISGTTAGVVDSPLLHLLKANIFFNPTSMIRRDFVEKHRIRYKRYDYAEDYRWWVDMALSGAVFYVIPQPLHYYRISGSQVSNKYRKEQIESSMRIRQEIADALIEMNCDKYPILATFKNDLKTMLTQGLVWPQHAFTILGQIFDINKNNLLTEVKQISTNKKLLQL